MRIAMCLVMHEKYIGAESSGLGLCGSGKPFVSLWKSVEAYRIFGVPSLVSSCLLLSCLLLLSSLVFFFSGASASELPRENPSSGTSKSRKTPRFQTPQTLEPTLAMRPALGGSTEPTHKRNLGSIGHRRRTLPSNCQKCLTTGAPPATSLPVTSLGGLEPRTSAASQGDARPLPLGHTPRHCQKFGSRQRFCPQSCQHCTWAFWQVPGNPADRAILEGVFLWHLDPHSLHFTRCSMGPSISAQPPQWICVFCFLFPSPLRHPRSRAPIAQAVGRSSTGLSGALSTQLGADLLQERQIMLIGRVVSFSAQGASGPPPPSELCSPPAGFLLLCVDLWDLIRGFGRMSRAGGPPLIAKELPGVPASSGVVLPIIVSTASTASDLRASWCVLKLSLVLPAHAQGQGAGREEGQVVAGVVAPGKHSRRAGRSWVPQRAPEGATSGQLAGPG